jgi:hypothetical protein
VNEKEARAIVRERAFGICEVYIPGICTGQVNTMHHRRKRSHGGKWAPSNLLALCGDGTTGCHGWIEGHPKLAQASGLWLMSGDGEPYARKVWMRTYNDDKNWVLLDDAGGRAWQ